MSKRLMSVTRIPNTLRRPLLALLAGMGLALAASPAFSSSSAHLLIGYNEIGRTQHVQVGVNKSIIVDLPVEAGEVIVSQPGVANAIMRTRSRAVIQGIAAGETNIFFLDPSGSGIAVIEISVAQDATGLAATINRLIPGSRIQVHSFANAVVLSGDVGSSDDVNKAIVIAGQFAGGEGNVTSLINVAGGQQVMLKVTVAEVKRSVMRELGINLNATMSTNASLNGFRGGGWTVGDTSSPLVGASFSVGNFSLDAALRALDNRNAIRLLAEPVLTAISGEQADFHVGGELPIQQTNGNGDITTIYKPYGIQLAFEPTVRSNGVIGLMIDTEVSEPQLNNTLNTRRASTSVELGNGQTLAIAGLIEERMRREINQLPGLGNIPILGALFRSHEYRTEQTELVILVTPVVVQPSYAQPQLPTDTYVPASDAEAIFLGRMENLYGVGGGHGGGQFRGSVGFVLD